MYDADGCTSKPMSIELIDGDRSRAWDEFVVSQPLGSFYHLFGWKALNEHILGHQGEYLAAMDTGGSIQGVLPLVYLQSRLFGRILCSVPFVNFGGPVAARAEVASLLVERATARAKDLNADYLELRCASPVETHLPASLRKLSLTVALPSDPDLLWKTFSSKHRNNIRRAQKHGLEVRSGGLDLLPPFYGVMEQSWRNLGTPLYACRYFRAILTAFGDRARIFACFMRGRPVAVALNGYLGGTVEGMWAGVTPDSRELQANYVLYWEMLRDASLGGYNRFHLGRSTTSSTGEQFKKKWNAESSQLYWYFHCPRGGPMPSLNVDNPRYRLAIQVWRQLPLWATRMIGPPIARLIP